MHLLFCLGQAVSYRGGEPTLQSSMFLKAEESLKK